MRAAYVDPTREDAHLVLDGAELGQELRLHRGQEVLAPHLLERVQALLLHHVLDDLLSVRYVAIIH